MVRNKNVLISLIMVIVSVVIAILCKMYGETYAPEGTFFAIINDIETGNQMRSILFGVLIFIYGYMINSIIFNELDEKWMVLLSAPVFYIIWSIISAIVVLIRIPYNRVSMLVAMLMVFVCVLLYGKNKGISDVLPNIRLDYILYALAVTIIISTGVFPIIMTGDSYNYILKYGIIIANEGALNFDSVGNYMAWTGISAAFFSSLGVFCGAENIQVFHYQLVFSSILAFLIYIYEKNKKIENYKKKIWLNVLFTALFVSFPMIYMMGWIINNCYFMCLFTLGIVVADKNRNGDISEVSCMLILSPLFVWLCLSRIETLTIMVFFAVLFSACLNLSKRAYMCITLPMVLLELCFIVITLSNNYDGKVDTLYNPLSLAINPFT